MFESKSKQINKDVLNHWIASADDFTLSPQEFYDAAEKQLTLLKIPGLEISRVEHAEGGMLSANRIYLRLMRERLAFDVCAAQFGTRYFFSCRTIYSPATVKLWHVIVVGLFFGSIYYGLQNLLGMDYALIVMGALVVAIGVMLRNVIAVGLGDVDAALLKTPVIGPIYEQLYRKDSYYRHDTRLMYLDTIPAVIQGLADAMTASKGVKLIRQYQCAPVLGELYKPLPPQKEKPTE